MFDQIRSQKFSYTIELHVKESVYAVDRLGSILSARYQDSALLTKMQFPYQHQSSFDRLYQGSNRLGELETSS